jgi:nitrogen regulatory protein PII
MVMVVYNEAMDIEVMEVLENCGLKNYTKVVGIFGKGTHSGTHSGNDIWPGKNNILYIACEEKEVKQLLPCVKELRRKRGHEGIKAFVLPVDELT